MSAAEGAAGPPAASALPPGFRVRADASMPIEDAAAIALRLVPVALAAVAAHPMLHGWASLREGLLTIAHPFFFVPALLASVVLHEGLHALGFLAFGRVRLRDVRFGVDRKTLSPYASCRVPLRAWAYRAAVLLPGVALAVLPIAAGLAGGEAWLTLWGAFMLVTAGGDAAVLLAMRGVAPRAHVVDHTHRAGCLVLERAAE